MIFSHSASRSAGHFDGPICFSLPRRVMESLPPCGGSCPGRRKEQAAFCLPANYVGLRGQTIKPFAQPTHLFEGFSKELEPGVSKIKKILYVPSDEERRMMSTTGTASFDFVLLQIDTPHTPREPIKLSTNPIQSGMRICAIGYPQYDSEYIPQSSIERLFQEVRDQVKRISYGEVMNNENNRGFRHDCSVVSGNSGSVICAYGIDAAIGIHTSGITRVGNYAIPASIIAEKLEEAKTRLAA